LTKAKLYIQQRPDEFKALWAFLRLKELKMSNAIRKESTRSKPALRLVSTNNLSREEWLDTRKQGIGGSDAAAAVGLSPYKSQLELWLEKTGRDLTLSKPDPNDDTSPVYWGTLLEPIVASAYTKRTGNRVRKINAVLQHPDPNLSWMLANLDREVVGNPDVSILECKTAGQYGAKSWRDGVPEYVQLQVQHQLAVTGKASADVAVLICGQALEVHRIHRDETLIERLIALEQQFWNYVISDTPPPTDGSESSAKALAALYPADNSELIDFTQDDELNQTFSRLLEVRQVISDTTQEESELKQRIQAAMGSASKCLFNNGEISWKKSKDSSAIDTVALLKDHPNLLPSYSITRTGSRRFLIS
jgi:putative phage-type endonuclease